jgi:hypothetical protein
MAAENICARHFTDENGNMSGNHNGETRTTFQRLLEAHLCYKPANFAKMHVLLGQNEAVI